MSLWDRVTAAIALTPQYVERTDLNPALQTRDIDPFQPFPTLEQQLATIMRVRTSPWRLPSIVEALGVPAIQRAVALISNTTGSLSVQGFLNGSPMQDSPRVVTRPDPYNTPRDFYRDSAYCLATRGETVWWIAARDMDRKATALIVVPLAELTVDENPRNRLFPIYKWGDVESTRYSAANPDGDFVHVTYLKDPGSLRGMGPLQMCGVASSVAVESQEWAANFFAEGGHPSVTIKSAVQLTEKEAGDLKEQWTSQPNNVPRVIDTGIEDVKESDFNPQGAQMLDARDANNGDASRMFGIPGALMEYGAPGSSLTYQNVSEVYTQFVRTCLSPNYLEPMEQALTDLLPRSQTARFSTKGLMRADIKTRFEVYGIGIDKGIITPEQAQQEEGYAPGSIEFAPVPFAPPAAVPSSLPQLRSLPDPVRCDGTRLLRGLIKPCGKLLTERGPFFGTCPRCRKQYAVA